MGPAPGREDRVRKTAMTLRSLVLLENCDATVSFGDKFEWLPMMLIVLADFSTGDDIGHSRHIRA